jgi:hypothetical protein
VLGDNGVRSLDDRDVNLQELDDAGHRMDQAGTGLELRHASRPTTVRLLRLYMCGCMWQMYYIDDSRRREHMAPTS